MTLRARLRWILFGAAFLVATGLTSAQQGGVATDPKTAALNLTIPVDPAITTGTFENGLRYYIRPNGTPTRRAELRLVVNAGSVLEDEDQRGLAHFVEHMAFNGTTHFPKMEIVNFMQSLGMRFGPHVNAYTSFDETVFELQVPADDPVVLDRCLLILEDWAHGVTFADADIDKERGVITEEWRLGLGADSRMQDKQFPILLKDSKYAERVPIGKMEVVQNVNHDRLKKFYTDWYRPDLMAVIAVGDFDRATMQDMVTRHFASIPKAVAPKPRPVITVPEQPGTRYTVATDKEATTATVQILSILPVPDPTTVGQYRADVLDNMFADMLSARLSELSQKPNAPILGGGASRGLFVRTAIASSVGAMVKEDGIDKGLAALFTEVERITKFGFTQSELEREKTESLKSFENLVTEKGTHNSSDYAAEYTRSATNREPIPGIDYENVLYHRFVPSYTLAEVNALAKTWTPERSRIIVVNAPEKPGLKIPDEAELKTVVASAEAATKDLKPYVDATSSRPLLDPLPEGGTITNMVRKAFGVTEWTLSNGARVVLLPTPVKEDEILFRGVAQGGTSLAPDKDFIAADTAAEVVPAGGLGSMNALELRKALSARTVHVQPFFSDTDEGVSGGSTKDDLETMFQLVYLTFTQPRADKSMFDVIIQQMTAVLANQAALPEFAFQTTLQAAITQNHFRARPFTTELVKEMDLDKSMAFYKDRFSDASGFTFTFVGSFDLETIKPLVERYLASLPSTNRHETWKDPGISLPKGIVEKRVEKGVDPKSQAAIVFGGPFQYKPENRVAIRAMADVLENRLRERLREALGGTYSVTVSPSYDKAPREEYHLVVQFGCDPSRTDELVKAVFEQIALLQAQGPTADQVKTVRETFMRDAESNLSQNGYFLSQISSRYENGEDLSTLFNITDLYETIDAPMIQTAAKQYLDVANHVTVTLVPEKKK
jgi:zinc protease